MENKNAPYMPITLPENSDGSQITFLGLSKREYFASIAIKGLITVNMSADSLMEIIGKPEQSYNYEEHLPEFVSKMARKIADKILNDIELDSNGRV